MIFYLLIGALSLLLAMGFSLLPCGVASATCTSPFLPLPAGVASAFSYIGNASHWVLYLFGDAIGDALVSGIQITFGILVAMMAWKIVQNFKIPIISRYTGSKP